ncbi:Uncharacterized protein APZ42_028989 [Daphnia magna]|uniref:Reverse transcriptase domain-containing protein n=1 Tax=Daphnia magna TaxID=35525 RepID=A0A164Q0J3_9CRUS|nr:Uncharacterized protein APZ42_028989 [Daphnia magna]
MVPSSLCLGINMSQGDGGKISMLESTTQPKQSCVFCFKPYQGKEDSKFCSKTCFHESQKFHSKNTSLIASSFNQESTPASGDPEIFSTPKPVANSKRLLSPDSSLDQTMFDANKFRHEDFTSLTDDPELSMIDTLPKEAISSKLRAALDFAKSQHTRIMKLEAELMDFKLAFADSMTLRFIKQRSVSPVEPSQVEPVLMGKFSYSQAVKGHQAPVLVATFTSSIKLAERISLVGVEELLGSSGGGPVPASVRQKENNIFILLTDPADLDRAKPIMESRAGPDSINVFNYVSRPSKLYPAVALFVNLSYLPSLKEELMVRDHGFRGKIYSISQLFAKPNSQKGHVKVLFNCKEARDQAQAGGEIDVFNTSARLVEVFLDREVRRCFKCQGYGHVQVSCRASSPSCGIASASIAEVIVENTLDVVLIQEPFAKGLLSPSIINIPPGYVAFHLLSKEHAYGAAVLVKLSLAKACRATNHSCDNHIAAVDLHLAQGTFRFISVYLRPSIHNIAEQLNSDLSCLFTKLSIIAIDSNALSKVWNSKLTNSRGIELELLIAKHFLCILNRPLAELEFVPAGTSFIDISLAGSAITSSRWFFPTIPSFSDHPYIYFVVFRSYSAQIFAHSLTTVPHISRTCIPKFQSKVAKAVKHLEFQPTTSTSAIDKMVVELTTVISTAANSSKCPSQCTVSASSMLWWTKDLWTLRNKSRQAFKLWSVQRSHANRQAFRVLKSAYQNVNPSTTVHKQMEERVDSFFPSSSPISDSISDPISQDELANAMSSLNLKSAPGIDGISSAIISSIYNQISQQLLVIMNACFFLSHFPSCWKIAKVTIIGKPNKPSYDILSSVRPISLVNTLAKILEKLVLNRFLWHSSTAQWLSPNQHGFTQGKSTETATHSLISFCDAAKEAKCVTACAFLDIKSAFDTAWHPAIISALADRKCPSYLIQLIYCFLSGRTAILSLDNTVSSFHVGLGCPQGGVLSPFLWSVLVDDALRLQFSFPSLIVGYADDLTVATYHKDPLIATRNLQSMCDGVNNWCLVNKLALNASKLIFMIICKKLFNWSHLSISINDLRIFSSAETLFLGLTIDCRLK